MSTAKKKFTVLATAIAILAVALISVCTAVSASAESVTGKTAKQITTEMGTGWNLGNTLDATGGGNSLSSETSWGNPKTTKAMIDAVKKQGFNTVRIPVSWGNHTSGNDYTIDSAWLARVKEVVDYCIDNDMYVILNIHHDTSTQYYYPSSTYKTQSVRFVKSIWSQVAQYFKEYDQHLVFETLNEPRLIGSGSEWYFPVNNPSSEVLDSINTINTLNQTAVDAIRSAGGKNTDRCIMIPGYCASIDGCTTSAFKLPTDTAANRLIVSVHAYTPYNFALNASGTSVFSDKLKSEVDYLFSTIKSKFIDNGTPVVIGETSASNKNGNTAERVKWAKYYFGKANQLGVPCVLWDNNVYNGSDKGECHGHLNRSTLKWYDTDFINAVINPSSDSGSTDTPPSNISGFSVKSKTSTAITLQWSKNTSADGYIIEQLNGSSWTKIADISGNATTSYTVKNLKAGTANYKFRMKAYKGSAYSDYTATVSANTNPYGVSGFKVKSKSSTSITLQWNKGTTAEGYQLQQYKNGAWVTVYTGTKATDTTYTVKGLKAGTAGYQFRIRAYKSFSGTKQYGSWSSIIKVNTNPYGVGGFKVKSTSKNSVTLQWNKGTTASGYELQQYKNGKWVTIATPNKAATVNYTIKSLNKNTSYKFRIRAYKTYGSTKQYGSWSSTLTAKTSK